MAQAFKSAADPANYTLGGCRLWFNRRVDADSEPPKYDGFRDLGNVVSCPLTQTREFAEHYSARSGARIRDRRAVKTRTEEFTATLDEPNHENLRLFFQGGDISEIGEGSLDVADEVLCLRTDEVAILGSGYQATDIVVTPIEGGSPLELNTDYTVEDVIGEYKGIKIKAGGALTSGDFVTVAYTSQVETGRRFAPLTETEVYGKVLFFGVSESGNRFKRSAELVQLEPDGEFSMNDQDFSNFRLKIIVLDNTDSVPTAPFGLFLHQGMDE
jgi:hypothetical protein